TGALAMDGGAVVVELQRHADDVVAFRLQQRRSHGGIDASRHRDDHTRVLRPAFEVEAVEHRDCFRARRLPWRQISVQASTLVRSPAYYKTSGADSHGRAATWQFLPGAPAMGSPRRRPTTRRY